MHNSTKYNTALVVYGHFNAEMLHSMSSKHSINVTNAISSSKACSLNNLILLYLQAYTQFKIGCRTQASDNTKKKCLLDNTIKRMKNVRENALYFCCSETRPVNERAIISAPVKGIDFG